MQNQIGTSTLHFMSFTSLQNGKISVAVMEGVVKNIIQESQLEGEKVIVVAVAGPARSGKSFLLNLLLHYYKHCKSESANWKESEVPIRNINWASGDEGITEGIWICEKPLAVETKDGKKVHILLIDTQGLGDNYRSLLNVKMDRLLLISTMRLCDLLIYNVTGKTTSHDLNGIFSILRSWDAMMQEQPLFSNLMFLYRDWQFTKQLGHLPEWFLTKVSNFEAKYPGQQNPYRSILQAFRNTTTFTSPYPGVRITSASEQDNVLLSEENIEAKFLDSMKHLFDMILGLVDDDAYFKTLVENAQPGSEIQRRLQVLKEWIEDANNIDKDEELEHTIFQKKVADIFANWSVQADKNFENKIKNNVVFEIPSPTLFLRQFALETAILNTTPLYSVYYQKLEQQMEAGNSKCMEMDYEYGRCRTEEEKKDFFKRWNKEELYVEPRKTSKKVPVVLGTSAAGVVAAVGIGVGIIFPPLGVAELAAGLTVAAVLGAISVGGMAYGLYSNYKNRKSST